ncbi:hypothetical protein [Dactylosporangium cerinum]
MTSDATGFHARDGWFFRRELDGSVRLTAPDSLGAGAHQTVVLDPDTWASAVASVCAVGETSATFRTARNFHGDVLHADPSSPTDGASVPFSRVQPPTRTTPGAASALYLTGAAWIIGGLLLCAVLWPDGDDLGGGKGPALLVLTVCLFAATVSFASGAILHRMAMWQVAEVEAERD